MITAQDLTKRYGDRTVVTGLSFTVRPGNASALDTVAGTPLPASHCSPCACGRSARWRSRRCC
ncbi:hypothetical protein SHKM778_91500 [Streptomyces sp. KM77-8]|uniref:ABC transporter ATP-binding protein n=1 Tax=Streptomyces haneummycinicus TaxID=3074435 RepID=A0AAT9HYS8_9ACTN